MTNDNFPMRFILKYPSLYIRKEDVVNYILELASTEETDVRIRLEEAAANLDKVGKLPAQENETI